MRFSSLIVWGLPFIATALGQPVSVASISPSQIAAGADTIIKISGYGFTSATQVLWNGQPRATTFVNDFLLKAAITQADLAQPGLAQISLADSNSGSQPVSAPVPVLVYLPLAHTDLAYDSARSKIYVSVSTQDPNGPAIAIVNPERGVVERYRPLPSEPGPLALSPDSHYLYVGMSDRIRRIDLAGSEADADVPATTFYGFLPQSIPFRPRSLLALQGRPTSFVVTINFSGFLLAFVVDGTSIRPGLSDHFGPCLVASPDGVTIYSGPGLHVSMLNDSGLASEPNYQNDALDAGPACPVYADGLIYGSDGDVVDAASHSRVRWLHALGVLDVVPEKNRIHFLDRQGGGRTANPSLQFKVFDRQSGSLLKSIPLGIQMSVANDGADNGHLIHWGSDGIAFGDYSNLNSRVAKWLYLIRVP